MGFWRFGITLTNGANYLIAMFVICPNNIGPSMKKFFFLISFFLIGVATFAQDSLAIYKRFPTVPPFKIINVQDSSFFKKDDLDKKKITMLIIFSPDCDHCQHVTKDLLTNAALFKKVQVVMAAFAPYEMVSKFYNDYGIAQHSNITMGVDQGYFLGSFYSIKSFPSVFLYNKKGTLIKAFEGLMPFSSIAASL